MNKGRIFILFLSFGIFTNINSSRAESDKVTRLYLKIIVFVDKTASINETGIPQLKTSDFDGLIDILEQNEGEIIIAEIKSNSKLASQMYYFKPTKVLPKEYGQSYEAYFNEMSRIIGDPVKNKEQNEKTKARFKNHLLTVCDYSKLYNSTDILGALEFGLKYLSEPPKMNKETINVAFYITDGIDTTQKKIGNLNELRKDKRIYLIRLSSLECVFDSLRPIEYTDFMNAISNLKEYIK